MLLTLCMVMSLFAGTTVTASAADGATTLYVNGVDTAGGSPAQYATAELKLNGYTAGAALNQATITTTSSTGFKSISLDGFMDKPDGKSDTIGNFSGTKTYYVILKMPRNTGYELQENDGKPVGVTLEGATPEPLSENKDFLIFKMNSKPAAAASTTSATDGTYSFTGIALGVYNIVAEEDDTTQTTLVIITNQSETGKDITMPNGKVNSKLTVNGADAPDVVAGGLDKEAAAVKNENSSATLVKVEMTVESKSGAEVNSTDKTNIETVASGKILEY